MLVLPGAALLPGLVVLHYVAGRFCERVEELNRNTSGYVVSTHLPDCFALLSPMAGVAVFLGSLETAIASASVHALIFGAVGLVTCVYLGFVALNPATLGVAVVPKAKLSEDAIGILTFVLKMLLQGVPVAFGIGAVCGMLMTALACYQAGLAEGIALLDAGKTIDTACRILTQWSLMPLAAYVAFLLCHVPIDLWRAVLALPDKMDAMAKPTKTDDNQNDRPSEEN
jgi:hypothetical protein